MASIRRLLLASALWLGIASGLGIRGKPTNLIKNYARNATLQDIVTFDEHSLFVYGERIVFFSGEFHPFRLPVPDLWLDVFQKIKALSYSGVSFYVDWALLEGSPGNFTAEGVFGLQPFFEAASEAGIYLLARPGPYINAEASGGGFPGWLARLKGHLRTSDADYLAATDLYMAQVGKLIADAQITNGGPVILVQPENEYTVVDSGSLDPEYMQYVENQLLNAGVVVPLINNDAAADGNFAPGTGVGHVDIYGHDSYPLGFDCSNPTTWPSGDLPTDFFTVHEEQSPMTPYSLVEFQGGSYDPWGGPGFGECAELLNNEFERLFYKNDIAAGVAILNIYMTYGGTNWGNLGQPEGYTSYDYGAAITESRNITREKYSEAKLQANFLQASGAAYLTATPGNVTTTTYSSNADIAVTPLFGQNGTNFYVARHNDYSSTNLTNYTLYVNTSLGALTLPQLGGALTLNGRDSKIHVTDYDLGGPSLIYSTAEVFSWKKSAGSKSVVVLYGGAGETHELAVPLSLGANFTYEGPAPAKSAVNGSAIVVQWAVKPERTVLHLGSALDVHLVWRNEAYNYWVLELPADSPVGNFTSPSKDAVIVKAGYLLRTASISGSTLSLTGDFNATTEVEVLAAPSAISSVVVNGAALENLTTSSQGRISGTFIYAAPDLDIPSLSSLSWWYLDSLPEIQSAYNDSQWTAAALTYTNNTFRNLTTPTSLYADDYGYHTGSLLYRGHIPQAAPSADGDNTLTLTTQGGNAFGHSVWLNSVFLGSFVGNAVATDANVSLALPSNATATSGDDNVLTVLIDHMGIEENYYPPDDVLKTPRGILDWTLNGQDTSSSIAWKLTGNLGGEHYADHARGPLNEGATYAERQGYHQPSPPSSSAGWTAGSPFTGLSGPGVGFYTAEFNLSVPAGYDVPLYFSFGNNTGATGTGAYRVQLFVNGYQFGKYVSNVGPESQFPVPEGILNYAGTNTVALTLWALEAQGAAVSDFELIAGFPVRSALARPTLSPQPKWTQRPGAY